MNARILVWDLPVRLGHWLMAGSFAAAWLTAESERWRELHVVAGYVFAAVIVFRVVWGVIGTRHARFASFVRGPRTVLHYLAGMASGRPAHYTGHNPAGALAIVALLALGLFTAGAGVANYLEIGGELFAEMHEAFANFALALVAVHLAGVAAGSLAHRENLVGAMLSGYKQGAPDEAITRARWPAAALLMAWVMAAAWGLRVLVG